ncbi:Uncharacterised protein [uncultured archaeon]|nr:Uncharacterised protein [uncultured archaeon]
MLNRSPIIPPKTPIIPDSMRKMPIIICWVAPSAFMTPISRVRSITLMNMVFAIPMLPTIRDIAAMPPRKRLSAAVMLPTCWFMYEEVITVKSFLSAFTLRVRRSASVISCATSSGFAPSLTLRSISVMSRLPWNCGITSLASSGGMYATMSSVLVSPPPLSSIPTTVKLLLPTISLRPRVMSWSNVSCAMLYPTTIAPRSPDLSCLPASMLKLYIAVSRSGSTPTTYIVMFLSLYWTGARPSMEYPASPTPATFLTASKSLRLSGACAP